MSDFWSKRLGSHTTGTHTTNSPQLPVSYNPRPVEMTAMVQGNPKAPSSLSTKSCPECGSGNYTGVPTDSTKMIRCYDCGYNPRFGQQSGAAGLPAGQSAPASPSRQVSTTSNYQPTTIIGRVG
jgi:hypothetical protein